MISITDFREILKTYIGLDIDTISGKFLENFILERMAKFKMSESSQYINLLNESPDEKQVLINESVVHESWFFRHSGAFTESMQYISKKINENSSSKFRILSIPCSKGEEPYSMAILLAERNIPTNQYELIGVDVSDNSINIARNGVYSKYAFRGDEIDSHMNWFHSSDDNKFKIDKCIKDQVNFKCGNLLDNNFLSTLGMFDIIFCRNVLIYMGDSTRLQVLKNLRHILLTNGLMFVGSSEVVLTTKCGFCSTNKPMSFGLISTNTSPTRLIVNNKNKTKHLSRILDKKINKKFRISTGLPQNSKRVIEKNVIKQKELPKKKIQKIDLSEVEHLANIGQFDAAEEICRNFLNKNPSTAKAYYLLGLIRDAKKDFDNAESYYRKAVYLSPDYQDALLQLAYLYENQGNFQLANNYKTRAKKIKEKSQISK